MTNLAVKRTLSVFGLSIAGSVSLIALWEFFDDALAQKLAHRKLVEHGGPQFLSYLRLRECRDVHRELV